LNLNVGYWDLFWPQLLQGFGVACIFVPLTVIAMAQVPREEMGNATSLFNLMRNLGGSMGIAVLVMLNQRYQQKYISVIGSHVSAFDPSSQQWFRALQGMFLGAGFGPDVADRRAYGVLFGMVQRQAAMLAFIDLFMLLTVLFLLMVPLVLFMRKPRGSPGVKAAMH
jgi:MFS transporter, DHA2 family, multidrug resistance protein